jgi:tetratricopeptide (TPR) repeat protein
LAFWLVICYNCVYHTKYKPGVRISKKVYINSLSEKILKKSFFILFLLGALISCSYIWALPNADQPASVFAFAEWLYEQGEYTRAAGEYLRFLFLSKKADEAGVWFKIGLCYKYAENYGKAIPIFKKILLLAVDDPLKNAVLYELAYCFFKLELYRDSLSVSMEGKSDQLVLLETANYLCLKEWEAAISLSTGYSEKINPAYREMALELRDLADAGRTLPQRSPVLAGILSSVIPGSGKIYAGRFMDGVFSLVTVGILGGMAVYSFYDEGRGSVKGWIYTGIGGIFYLGNIYGSVVAANLFNQEQQEMLIQKVRKTVATQFP